MHSQQIRHNLPSFKTGEIECRDAEQRNVEWHKAGWCDAEIRNAERRDVERLEAHLAQRLMELIICSQGKARSLIRQ